MNNNEWNRESSIQLIELYEERPVLWNPNNNNYHMKTLKYDAWKEIADKVKRNLKDVKQKMTSLLSSFRREKLKIKKEWVLAKVNNNTEGSFSVMEIYLFYY